MVIGCCLTKIAFSVSHAVPCKVLQILVLSLYVLCFLSLSGYPLRSECNYVVEYKHERGRRKQKAHCMLYCWQYDVARDEGQAFTFLVLNSNLP